jgi:hypothetical protein
VPDMTALPTHCDYSPDDFDATAITSGGIRVIQVTGSAKTRGTGWRLDFAPVNCGVVPEPERVCLTIRETPPRRAGRYWGRASVEAMIEDAHATEIVIHFGWRPPIRVSVREASPQNVAGERPSREPVPAPAARKPAERPFETAGRMV